MASRVQERAVGLIQIAEFRDGLLEYCERSVWFQHPEVRPPAMVR